jgi:tetratricopeptide (TPR) repeat protein
MGVDAQQFLAIAEPALAGGRASELAEAVSSRWTPAELCPLLQHGEVDVRRVAAVTLGLIGDRSVIDCLARALHDKDPQVNEMAEHGLWSIWFRLCSVEAAEPFQRGLGCLEAERYDQAIAPLREAQQFDPDFAEAYNQCAIAHFFRGELDEAIDDCHAAIERMPCHFGAMAGLGHCYTQLDRLDEALACYHRTFAIHPRMGGIRQAIDRIESKRRRTEPTPLPSATVLSRSRF